MKQRKGFVSNSSSSSFVIHRSDLTRLQLVAIRHHTTVARWFCMDYCDDAWRIEEGDVEISGFTFMDNFNMSEFLDEIGVTKVKWE